MEEKEENLKEDEKIDKGSNLSVMDLSIDAGIGTEEVENKEKNNEKNEIDNSSSLNRSFDNFLNFTSKLNLIDNLENILDYGEEKKTTNDLHNIENRKIRSKIFKIKKKNNLMAPKPKLISIDEYIKPLRLDSKKSIAK